MVVDHDLLGTGDSIMWNKQERGLRRKGGPGAQEGAGWGY